MRGAAQGWAVWTWSLKGKAERDVLHVTIACVFPEEIYNRFSFLRNVFSNEFILCPGATLQVRNMFSMQLYSTLTYGHCDVFLSLPVVLCVAGLRGGLLPAAEDRNSANEPAGGSGNGERAQDFGLPHQCSQSVLARISGESAGSCLYRRRWKSPSCIYCRCMAVDERKGSLVHKQIDSCRCPLEGAVGSSPVLTVSCLCLWWQAACRFLCEEEGLAEQQFIPGVRKFIIKHLLTGSSSLTFLCLPFVSSHLQSSVQMTKCEVHVCYAGRLRHIEVLSSDLQKNALAALMRLGAVQKIKGCVGFTHQRAPLWVWLAGSRKHKALWGLVLIHPPEETHYLTYLCWYLSGQMVWILFALVFIVPVISASTPQCHRGIDF